jgi:glyoxylase-like metal-dependent hydrolase (beta-lactamase superfamily II)
VTQTLYTIEPVYLGKRTADTSMFLYLTEPGVTIEIAYRLWLLRSAQRTIVVDTGPPVFEGRLRGLTETLDARTALAAHGVDTETIDTVLLTHLHWDHAANASQFAHAQFFAQRSEIDFLRDERRRHGSFNRFFSEHAQLERLIDAGRLSALDGDVAIDESLHALRVGGHTPGSQMFVVDTPEGRAVLTGDAVPLHRNYVDRIPSGILVNTFDAVAATERVHALDPVRIYTGHDIESSLRLG